MKKRLLAGLMACALVLSLLPTAALAAGETGAFTVTGGALDTDYSYADNTLTVLTSMALTISGTTTTDKIVIQDGVTANVTLNGVNIQFNDGGGSNYGTCAFEVAGNAICNLTLTGANTLKGGYRKAGLQVQGTATLTITESSTGSLDATGGNGGAGIGGSDCGTGGTITINGGTTNATGGWSAAGIGGGGSGAGGTITINDGTVVAIATRSGSLNDGGGAGIGGGYNSSGGTVTINGGTIKATGNAHSMTGSRGADIGAGCYSSDGTITVDGATLNNIITKGNSFTMTSGTLDHCTVENSSVSVNGAQIQNSSILNNLSSWTDANNTVSDSTLNFSSAVTLTKGGSGNTYNGTVTIADNAEFKGNTTFSSTVTISGDSASFSDSTTFKDAVTISGNNASFSGSTTFSSTVDISGNTALGGNTTLTKDVTINQGSSLTNSGLLTVPADCTITNHATIINNKGAVINLTGVIDNKTGTVGTVTNNGTIFLIGTTGKVIDMDSVSPNLPVSGGASPVPAGEIVIDLSTVTSTVTIGPKEYTIDGTAHAYDPARNVIVLTGEYKGTISGTNTAHAAAVTVLENTTASITLRDVNIGWEKDYTYYCSSIWVKDYCAVTVFLEGNNTLKPKDSGSGIRTEEHSSLTVEGTGTLNLDLSNGSTIRGIGNYSYNNENFGSITINGGTINETIGSSTNTTSVAAVGGKQGTLVINGGTLKGDYVFGAFQLGKLKNYQCVINGGVINSTMETNINYGSLTINGGEVSMLTVYCYGDSGGNITVNGGQLTLTSTSGNYMFGDVTINGGTITGRIGTTTNGTTKINGGSAKLTDSSGSTDIASVTTSDGKTAYRTVLTGQTNVADLLVDGVSQNISYNHPSDTNLYLYLVHEDGSTSPEHTVVVMYQDGNRKEYKATWNSDHFEFGTGTDSTTDKDSSIGMTMTGTTTGTDGKPEKTYGDAVPVVVTVKLSTQTTTAAPSNGPMRAAANSLPYAFKTVILLCTDENGATREIERKDVPENQKSVVFYVQTQAWTPGEYKFTATYGGDATTGSSAIAETNAQTLNIVGQTLDVETLGLNFTVSGTYGQKVSELTASGTVTQDSVEIPGTLTVSGDTVLEVGTTQTVTVTFTPTNKKYAPLTTTVTPTISKATPSVTAPTAASGLTYTGSAQALISGGNTTGGTLQYSTDNATWSTDLPTGTNAGSYTVYYKVDGGDNYNDMAAGSGISVTISKATPTVTAPTNLTATYGQTLANMALPSGWAWNVPTTSVGNVGDNSFPATYTRDNSGNYNTVQQNLTVTVSAAPRTITVTGMASSPTQITLNEAVIDPSGTGGTVSYGKNTTNTAPSDWQTGKEFSGLTADTTYYFFAKVEAAGNYAAAVSAGVAISTPAKAVSSIAIATQPTTLTYTSGQTLDLSGLSVTVTYNDNTTGTIEWSDGKLTADPAAGTALTVTGHHGKTVTISYGGKTATTNALTVTQGTQAAASITGAPATIYNGDSFTLTLSGGSGTGAVTWEIVSGPAKVDATTGKVTVTGTGEIKIKVVKAADTDYTQAEVTITLNATTRPTPPTGGGGGGGGYTPPTYKPDITKPSGGGDTPSVSPSNPKQGDTVTVTPKPDDGHEVGGITVTDKNGKPVEVTQKPDGTYTFKQPNGKVTIEVTYRPIDRPWNNPFSDVSESDWFYEAVKFVHQRGLMNGYNDGRFGPNDNLSRAQLAQILFNKEGRPGVNYLLTFSDVAGEAWYTEAIRWATSQGIVGGYGNGMFGPNDPITREQLAVMLWRYSGNPAATDKELHFNDADEISGFALEAMRWAVENGVLNGYGDGRLGPKGQATRAQVAQMLKNFIEKQEEENT